MDVKIIPTKEIISERVYANFFSVNHGPIDFTFIFCDVQPPVTEEEIKKLKADQILKAPVQVEIAVPVALVEQIIEALNKNFEIYKKTYGKDKE